MAATRIKTQDIMDANVTNVKLDTTGVSAATYKAASMTVNAQGRVTSASNILTAKGDILVFDTDVNRLPVGTNGQFFVADSTQASGLKWYTLTSSDITTALGYTPVNKAGDTMTGFLTLNADPTNPLHAATKQYVDAVATGLDVKLSVRVMADADVDISSAPASIDGVTLNSGDRILLNGQTLGEENGIYIFNGTGNALTRSPDADVDAEVTAGMFTFVEEGDDYADTGWVLATDNPITLDTTPLLFTQFSSAGVATASNLGTGSEVFKAKVGTDFQFRRLNAGSSKISVTQNTNDISIDAVEANFTLNNIGGTLAANKGGTGFSSYAVGDMLYADSTSTLAKLTVGTANQVLTSNGTNPAWSSSLTLTNLTVSSTLTLSGLTASRLLALDGSGNVVVNPALTANGAVYATGSGALASTAAMTDGQLLIGRTGNTPVLNTLTGTTDQVIVTNGAGSITLSLPQDIATTSSPTFAGLTIDTLSGVLKATAGVVSGSATTTDLPEGTNLYFTNTRVSTALNSIIVDNEIPSGTIDGVNDTFNLAFTPVAGTEHVYKNGLRQRPGGSNDYTISGGVITFNAGNIPQTGDVLIVDYRK